MGRLATKTKHKYIQTTVKWTTSRKDILTVVFKDYIYLQCLVRFVQKCLSLEQKNATQKCKLPLKVMHLKPTVVHYLGYTGRIASVSQEYNVELLLTKHFSGYISAQGNVMQ